MARIPRRHSRQIGEGAPLSNIFLNRAFLADLKGNCAAKFLLVALANHADKEGVCFPGQLLLANETGLSVRTVQRLLVYLEEQKLIVRKRRCRSEGRGKGRDKDIFFLTIGPSGQPDALLHSWSTSGRPTRQPVRTNVPMVSRHIDEPSRTIDIKQKPSNSRFSEQARATMSRTSSIAQQKEVQTYLTLALEVGQGDQDVGVILLDSLPRSELDYLITRRMRGPLDFETLQRLRAAAKTAPKICTA